jgi:hypothetical protein
MRAYFPPRAARELIALRAVALLAAACASSACGGYSRQQVYAPLKPTVESPVPVKLNNRHDYVEFHLGDASVRIYHVVMSERLAAVFGPAIIIPTPGAKETVQEGPLQIDLHFDIRRGAVVALDPHEATVRLADGRELAPEVGGGQVVLAERFRLVRLVYAVPRVGLGSFALRLPLITVNGRAVELPPVVFRLKRRGSNS